MARKLINIRLSEELWQEAKVSAAKHKVSLQDWLSDAIILKLKEDDDYLLGILEDMVRKDTENRV